MAVKEVQSILKSTISPKSCSSLRPHDIKIDFKLLLKVALEKLEYEITNNKLMKAFQLFDMDGNGSISMEEIQYLLSGVTGSIDGYGSSISSYQGGIDVMVESVVSKFGAASDGELNFNHFK